MLSIKQRYPQKTRKKKIKSKSRLRNVFTSETVMGRISKQKMKFLQNSSFSLFSFSGKMQTRCKQFFKTLYYVSHRPELSKQIRSLILVCIYTFKNSYYWLCWMPWLLENHYSSRDSFLFGIVSIWSPECHDLNADSRYACVKWYGEKGKVHMQ